MTATTTQTLASRPAHRSLALRLLPAAGATYVLAWLVGLVSAPAAPANGASAASIHRYFTAHSGAATVQALLVHGIAGVALLALTAGFVRALRPTHMNRLIAGSGCAAAAVSLTQFGFALAAAHDVRTTDAATTAGWFHAINYADTIKLILLAAFAASVTRAARHTASRWLRIIGRVLVPMLILGGLEFVLDNIALSAALDLSLIALLIWAGGTAWQLGRRHA